MNETFRVGSNFDCDAIPHELLERYDPTWRHTVLGCIFLHILQDMYKFDLSYVIAESSSNFTGEVKRVLPLHNDTIDIYVTPLTLRAEFLDHAYPVEAVFIWRFGFILQRAESSIFSQFYSKPFSRPAWNCLYAMALLVTMLFYLLKCWEKRLMGGVFECSIGYEILMVIGAYCQHIPPLDAVSTSRRMAYLCFFIFAYIVYTYYTSNLLSHLVNDKDHNMELESLTTSHYNYLIVDYMKVALEGNMHTYNKKNKSISVLENKLLNLKPVDVISGLEAVKSGKFALLSDYTTLYPIIKQLLDGEEICKLVEVDLYSKMKKYLFTSNDFAYKEQFKIGLLRIREAGIMIRLITKQMHVSGNLRCDASPNVRAKLIQITIPLAILGGTYVACLIIFLAEKIHYKRNRTWPYVE